VGAVAAQSDAASWLRLRQICLVANDFARETELVREIFGLEACYRDPNVARYGLENVLFPVGTDFIEIVSPTRPGTAAGRFLERHQGRNGYMIIMDCEDPVARQAHCESLGVRTANLIRHDAYLGVQLHPKDTGGAMLEFNRTEGGRDPMGPYAPAGSVWQSAIRQGVTQRLVGAEIECADPAEFSSRWAEILQRPVHPLGKGGTRIALDSGRIDFLPAGREAVLAGIELQVASRKEVFAQARELGCVDEEGEMHVCGMRIRLSEEAE
jgi:hypothetical protein